MQEWLDKHPEKVIHHAVSKMLPKNRNRAHLFKNYLIVHPGPVHTQLNYKLPQFSVPQPHDINKTFEIDYFTKENSQIEWMSDPKIPVELEGYDQKIDETFAINPILAYKKRFTYPKENRAIDKHLDRNFRANRRYKVHKK